MNKQKPNGSIGWSDWSWSPLTGCTNGCDYCYARAFTRRFGGKKEPPYPAAMVEAKPEDGAWPYGFHPTFYEHRLTEPAKCAKPSRIFTVSMGDLFGPQVPDWVIAKVFQAMRQAPQHQFLLLTKQPDAMYRTLRRMRYTPHQFDLSSGGERFGTWPDDYRHVLVGTSLTGDPSESWRIESLRQIAREGLARTFLSLEPLLREPPRAELITSMRHGLEWLIVGGQTGARKFAPPAEWIDHLAFLCGREGVPLFVKSNAGYGREVKEFPKWR